MAELLVRESAELISAPLTPCKAFFGVPIEAADEKTRKIRAPEGAKQRGFARWRGFWERRSSPKLRGSGNMQIP